MSVVIVLSKYTSLAPRNGYKLILPNDRIRRPTPLECFRLQSFSDDIFERGSVGISDAQLYKMAGNSVTVNVVDAIMQKIIKKEEQND